MACTKPAKIALSFDVEEFDLPSEHGVRLPMEKQLQISSEGLTAVLDLLEGMNVKATFFCTAHFAEKCPQFIHRIIQQGHSLASHSYYHSKFEPEDLLKSRLKLEEISGQPIKGYRAPRMASTSAQELLNAGYKWDSSLNPCFLPGRYNNFSSPTSLFYENNGLIEVPASVSPLLRLPLFWLSLHNLPLGFYKFLCNRTLRKTGFLNVYFHPWEFSEYLHNKQYRVPYYIARNSGKTLIDRLASVIVYYKDKRAEFITLDELTHSFSEQSLIENR